jgi:CRP-like cAMP-binding protein
MISPEILRRYPYFAHVGEESLRDVAMISDEQVVPAGKVLFQEGDKADYLYIITDGEIDIQYTLGSGEQRTVDTAVAGELIMWSALVEPYRSTAVGTTRKDTKLVAISAEKLRQLCERDYNLGYRMVLSLVKMLATRLEGARVQLATVD